MRYVIFTNTPAHVHLYKHVVSRLQEQGHEVLVLARDYGCTVALADAYELPYRVYGKCDTSKKSLLLNLPLHYLRSWHYTHKFRPDLVLGMGAYAAHAGAITRTPVILVLDSEPTTLDHRISKPFASALLTPDSFRGDLGSNHYVFHGFKECAYLHPDVFGPDPSVRDALGVGDGQFAILRFNAFGSHHDVDEKGFTDAERRELVETLAKHLTVVVSDEGGTLDLDALPAQPFELHPARLHDALAEASLLVADTQTMVTEAALLGTPAIRSNSFVGEGDMGNFKTLEEWGLVYNFADFADVLERAEALARDRGAMATWRERSDQLLGETVNLTALLVDVAENYADLSGVTANWSEVEPSVARDSITQ